MPPLPASWIGSLSEEGWARSQEVGTRLRQLIRSQGEIKREEEITDPSECALLPGDLVPRRGAGVTGRDEAGSQGRRMAPQRAVQLSLKKPTYAVCVVGVETYVDVHR